VVPKQTARKKRTFFKTILLFCRYLSGPQALPPGSWEQPKKEPSTRGRVSWDQLVAFLASGLAVWKLNQPKLRPRMTGRLGAGKVHEVVLLLCFELWSDNVRSAPLARFLSSGGEVSSYFYVSVVVLQTSTFGLHTCACLWWNLPSSGGTAPR